MTRATPSETKLASTYACSTWATSEAVADIPARSRWSWKRGGPISAATVLAVRMPAVTTAPWATISRVLKVRIPHRPRAA